MFEENVKLLAQRWPAVALRARGEGIPSPLGSLAAPNGAATLLYTVGLRDYTSIKPWLAQDLDHRVIFLEKEAGNLVHWLESEAAAAMLADPQLEVHFFETLDDPVFDDLCARHAKHKVAADGSAAGEQLIRKVAVAGRIIDEFRRHADLFYENFYTNLFRWHEAVWGVPLFGKFEGVPAIICGAGPSLDKQIPLLKTLRDKALIFAGGSALNATSCSGLQPHFGAGVDPHSPQVDRLRTNAAVDVPMFYRHRWHPGALPLVKGTPLYLNGSGGQQVAEWFEKRLGIEGPVLDEGHNVVNWTVEIARALGCDPIICVGLDLGYTGGVAYASGVAADGSPIAHHYDQLVERNGVKTHWKWIAEAEWLGERGVINATEGGIGIPGATEMRLADIPFEKSWPLDERIHTEIEKARAHKIDQSRVLELLDELEASLERSIEKLDRCPNPLDEVELEEEPAFEAILAVMDYVHRNQNLTDDRFAFLKEAATKNLGVLRRVRHQHRPR